MHTHILVPDAEQMVRIAPTPVLLLRAQNREKASSSSDSALR